MQEGNKPPVHTPYALAADPARAWAKSLQANIFGGGMPGCMLVIVALVAMIAAAIAGIVIGYQLLGAIGITVRKRSLWPFAALGIPAGMLVFHLAAPVLYRMRRQR